MKKNTEPVFTVASIVAAGSFLLSLLVVFGLDIDKDTTQTLLAGLAAVAPLLVTYARKYVEPLARPKRGDTRTP